MKVAIIGTGNVGSSLHKTFVKTFGVDNVFWHSRSPQETQLRLNEPIVSHIDVVLLAVPDGKIVEVANGLFFQSKSTILAHVSGATPSTDLKACGQPYGVFYPVQTIRKDASFDWSIVPICVTAQNDFVFEKLFALASAISQNVVRLEDSQRLQLHLAAVMVNNFTNHLAVLTRDYLENKGIDFGLLSALIQESAHKLTKDKPDFTQTGPAIRGDLKTIARHQEMLAEDPQLQELYTVLSQNILSYYENKNNK